ncbi:hypothetical protein LTR86_005620 [Recurvomyces mirabilis]|nr:hypothetical protein LTR86_005620 [Recurvomyces mirabilis]
MDLDQIKGQGHQVDQEHLQNCGVNITPTCIQALYGIPRLNFHNPVNKLGLFETADTFVQADTDLDFQNFTPWVPTGTTPEVKSVDGGEVPVPADSPLYTGEFDVDIELAQSLIYPQNVVVYQIDDLPNALGETGAIGVGNTFIDSVDGSYYTNFTGGYTGQRMCGVYQLTRVMAAVSKYLSEDSPCAPSYVASADASNLGEGGGLYNRVGRGYPDVSANGAFLLGHTNLTQHWQFGTSLATPVFASVINLINEERAAAGKDPVGSSIQCCISTPEY